MLVAASLADRASIDLDSTAVLAFDDGTRIPCDRFIMRTFCVVIRKLLESSAACDVDARGRTVLPVPAQDAAPYWVAVDLLHGARAVWQLGLHDAVATLRAMEFLGAAAYDLALDARLWALLCQSPLDALLEHAPRLLRNATLAAAVVRRLIKLRPVWADFVRDVLRALEAYADQQVVTAVMTYAPNFFPPALVLDWALAACHQLNMETALRLASYHGVMYHPCEVPSVLRRLAAMAEERRWTDCGGGALPAVLRMTLASLEKFDALPWAARKVHGTQVKYHDVPCASLCLVLEPGRLPRHVKLAPWLRLHLCQLDGALGLSFKPRAIDPSAASCTALQLRVMCFDSGDAPRAQHGAEAWYLFEGIGEPDGPLAWWTLDHATSCLGSFEPIVDMLRLRTARQLRLDFFFGARSVLDSPYDILQPPAKAV